MALLTSSDIDREVSADLSRNALCKSGSKYTVALLAAWSSCYLLVQLCNHNIITLKRQSSNTEANDPAELGAEGGC